jgi:hypothetical protein
MKVLLVGEDRHGALLRSFAAGLRPLIDLTVVDPAHAATMLLDRASPIARLRRRRLSLRVGACFLEAVEQLRPDVTLMVKGRGIDPETIRRARAFTRIVIQYPDNPFWRVADTPDALERLGAADMAVVWSARLRDLLRPSCSSVEVLPFGYDDDWFPLTTPRRTRVGIAFVGTWSLRRERYLRALDGLPLTVIGSGWHRAKDLRTTPPLYGTAAGEVLQSAAISVNVFHPHNSGAHNMRTREIAASGALQLTDPGVDGSPFRDGVGCRWFRSPAHLRGLAEHYLARPADAVATAERAQELAGGDTYRRRSVELVELFERVLQA